MAFVKAATKADIPAGSGKVIEMEGATVALFNVDGSFHAIDNRCQHRGGPLGEGALSGTTVSCPLHAWDYEVTTGKCVNAPFPVARYDVKVEGEDILIDPESAATAG